MNANLNRRLINKQIIEEHFPKKKENLVLTLNNNLKKDPKFEILSNVPTCKIKKIPKDINFSIKKTIQEILNNGPMKETLFFGSDNKAKIETMKDKVSKYFK